MYEKDTHPERHGADEKSIGQLIHLKAVKASEGQMDIQ